MLTNFEEKKKSRVWVILLLTTIFISVITTDRTFAAISDMEMPYKGGSLINGKNVTVDESLIQKLSPLIGGRNIVQYNGKGLSKEGYIKLGTFCRESRYFEVTEKEIDLSGSDVFYDMPYGPYNIRVKFEEVRYDYDKKLNLAVGVVKFNGAIAAGLKIYEDNRCSKEKYGSNIASDFSNNIDVRPKLFIRTRIKLLKSPHSDEEYIINNLWFSLDDIDYRQSVKILNSNNKLSKNNMYVRNVADLQPIGAYSSSPTSKYGNVFVESKDYGNYIYSAGRFAMPGGNATGKEANIYLKVNREAQEEGLDVVFGWGGNAGAIAVGYYVEKFKVEYVSGDKEVKITGKEEEVVIKGYNPSGTTVASSYNYYWVADKDVKLKDGRRVSANVAISDEDITQVIVEEDIIFKALKISRGYSVNYKSDGEGSITGLESETVWDDGHPSGSSSTPEEKCWRITYSTQDGQYFGLEKPDGSIEYKDHGACLKSEDVRRVIVDRVMIFTAIHEIDNRIRIFGSWAELGMIGTGVIKGIASGATTGYTRVGFFKYPGGIDKIDFCSRSVLSFANTNCKDDWVGGMSMISPKVSNRSVIDFVPELGDNPAVINKAAIDLNTDYKDSSTNGIRYTYKNGGLEVGGATVQKGVSHVVYATGKITIAGDLEYEDGYSNLEEIPKLFIYAEGGIDIHCGVSRIDAVLFSVKTINTCSDIPDVNAEGRSNRLQINGTIITGKIVFNRTYGAGVGNASMVPAEIVNYDSTLYMWAYETKEDVGSGGTGGSGGSGGGSDRDAKRIFDEVGREELPPRY